MKKSDIIIGAIVLGLAIFVYIETLSFPETIMTPGIPPASFFPRVLSGALALGGILLIVSGIRAKPEVLEAIKWKNIYRAIAGMVLMVIYVILMPHTDFFILTPLCLILPLMLIMGMRSKRMLILIPILFVLLVYFIFFKGFGIMFPTKIFG